jgi:hypothetical protein
MNFNEKQNLLYNFPKIELSYEKTLHKKVQNIDCYLTIPFGTKYFAWFHNFNNQNSLFIFKINKKNNKIANVERKHCSFKSNLCIGVGTIFYGTIFNKDDINFFNIEDMFFYKNKCLKNFSNLEKFNLEYNILKNEINQVIYQKNDIIFGLPIITQKYKEIFDKIKNIPYKLYSIQHRFLNKNINIFYNQPIIEKIYKYAIFRISPTVQPDIYQLQCKNKNNIIDHGLSNVSSYKNSVFLNSIFRNIKENENLDYLEESDDEEEFENICLTKFMKDVCINMKCIYNRKFKSWEPIARSNENISDISFISTQEK